MADAQKKIANLTVEQRDRLFRRLRAGLPAHTGIPRRQERDAPAPLSFAQQRLWFFDQLQPGSAAYNMPIAVEIAGPLDFSFLQATLETLVQRHETLRTTFQLIEGEARQVIAPHQEAPLRSVDLRGLPPAQSQAETDRLCNQEVRAPFDLGKGPLMRAKLLHLAPERAVLLLSFHHIISDLWSLAVFIRELTETYSALQSGRAPVLPELPIQYADFAAWQREQLQGERLEKEVEHWKNELAGAQVHLELPTDYPRPPVMGFRGTHLEWGISPEATDALKALGQQEGSTPFMTTIAAYGVLLARYSSQEDLIVGAPVANRSQVELEGLIGFFINLLVLRVELTQNPSFRELLARVKDKAIRGLQHQALPFDYMVDDLVPERDLSRPPLVQAALAFQNVALPSREIAGLRFTAIKTQIGITKFDLLMELSEEANHFRGSLEYNIELFESATAQRMANHFVVLLAGICAHPERSVWELPLLTEAEIRQLSWQSQRPAEPAADNVAELVAAVAARQPTARAAAWQGGEISYGELTERAGRIAAGLRALGAGPEVLVGVLLERSADLLAGILGVLTAGGACLLLDPRQNPSWLERTLERSGVPVLLTAEPLRRFLPEHGADEATIERLLEKASEPVSEAAASPESLAFVVHTSGSRRAPRQVALEHRSVLAWVRHWGQRLSAGELAGVGPVGALETVDGVFGLIVPLCLGGWVALDEAAAGALRSATPSELAVVLRAEMPGARPRSIRSFGEALGAPLSQRLLQAGVGRVYDSYSSAVGGVWDWGAEVTAYVLDRAGELVPAGVPGELWLSGEGLARGYSGNAGERALTAESFRPDRFSGRSGARLVRTGDLARWRADGSLELLGSLERRVQVNGQRLDLGLVEGMLAEHPGVLRAAAGFQGDDRVEGAENLVAYALSVRGSGTTAEELRRYLAARLPGPQMPRSFLVIEDLPRTPSGRTDWQALPRIEEKPAEYVAPRTETEEMLAAIWRDLLHVEQIGVDDNFFRLGGNSILATQVVVRINQTFQVELGVEVLFRQPTLSGLAVQIEEHLLAQIGDADLEALLGTSELSELS